MSWPQVQGSWWSLGALTRQSIVTERKYEFILYLLKRGWLDLDFFLRFCSSVCVSLWVCVCVCVYSSKSVRESMYGCVCVWVCGPMTGVRRDSHHMCGNRAEYSQLHK